MKKSGEKNPRLLAIEALADVLDRKLNLTDSPALQDSPRSRDLSMSRHLAYGVLRWWTALDWLAAQMLSKPLKQRDQDIHRLVLLGLYQLWQDQTAPHAAIHETTECARLAGKPWAVGMINAILRRFQREQEQWIERLNAREERFAHPPWLLKELQTDWPNDWQDIAQANNQQPPLWLRINCRGPGKNEVIERLEDQGFEVESNAFAADAVCITPAVHVTSLPGFAAGHFSVQDPAAQLAVDLLKPEAGERILDACAAPGGKTCHILERQPTCRLTAIELIGRRLELIRQNLARLKLKCALINGDAAKPGDWWDGQSFQKILLDAPCSASGVIRRHPEIKHLRQPGQIADAVNTQHHLLQQLWPLLEPGGILVYATCSLLKDENNRQIKDFLSKHAEAEASAVETGWGRAAQPGRQIFPGEQGMDGFYYAVLQKN